MRTLSTCIAISAAVPFFLGGSFSGCLLAQTSAASWPTYLTNPSNQPLFPSTFTPRPAQQFLLARSESLATGSADPASIAVSAPLSHEAEPSFSSSAGFAFGFISANARPCRSVSAQDQGPDVDSAEQSREPCLEAAPTPDTRHLFLNSTAPVPLTPGEKFHLAERSLFDPGNLATILGNAGFTIATNAHTPYGPGWKGFAGNAGVSFTQDMTGVFFSTFLIPTLTHEDPHYHRMPHANFPRRVVHAISRTVMAQSDTGKMMPNFATLLGYPIGAEFSNLYVPGIHANGPSTVARIATGYATDPINNLITEFLPDVARHIQVRVIFAQRILNQIATDQYALP
jgi:hypothetical protein